jgi:hypothetical protein
VKALVIVSLLVALAASPVAAQAPRTATHKELVERLSRALPAEVLIGFPDAGPLSRPALEVANPGRAVEIKRLVERQLACQEPFAGSEVLHGLAVAALEAALTDAQLADIAALAESPDFTLMVEMLEHEPLGGDLPEPMQQAAKRVLAQPSFRLLARTTSSAVVRHLERPEVMIGLAACDDRLKADLAEAGLQPGV